MSSDFYMFLTRFIVDSALNSAYLDIYVIKNFMLILLENFYTGIRFFYKIFR